ILAERTRLGMMRSRRLAEQSQNPSGIPMQSQIDSARTPAADPNRARNLGFFFDASVRATSDKVAVIDLFGGRERQITYRALDQPMDRVAAVLAGRGARAGERIGVLVGNRVEFLEVFFGAMRIGAIPVILNTRLAADTLTAIFADAGCRIAVIDP